MRTKITLLLVLSLLALTASAGDYVDDINNATKNREAGHKVIYELNVGMFTAEGTFKAAQQKLGELKTLGVDIVWLMPVYPRGASNSPYAPTNFKKTNPKYGTVSDLKDFVGKAHELKMEVWLDWVPNHTANEADWVTEHPEYYGWNGQKEFRHPSSGSITYSDVWQLNYYREDLKAAMSDALKFWINEADIDGYRCDYVSSPQIPASYWNEVITEIKGYKPGKNISFLGEADIVNDATGLQKVGFDYDYAWGYQSSLAAYGTGVYSSTLKVNAEKLIDGSKNMAFGRMLYVTNHDQNWNESKKTLTQKYGDNRYPLTVLAYTLYGMPLIYNGQETGGNQALDYFADTKIDWNARDAKMKNTLRTLTALKHDVAALADKAEVTWVASNPVNANVLAFTRKAGDSEVLVVLNMATAKTEVTLTGLAAGEWSLWLNSETISQGVSRSKANLTATSSFTVEGKGYKVYVKGSFSEEELPAPEVYTPTLDSTGEISIFFETPNADAYAVWAWGTLGGGEAYCTNTNWPGDNMTLMGQTATGNYVYKCVLTRPSEAPQSLIISKNSGNDKIYDGIDFVNHGYYVEGQTKPTQVITATTGIGQVVESQSVKTVYDLSGRRLSSATPKQPGIYIVNGKKYVVRK